MYKNTNELPSERHQESKKGIPGSKKVFPNRANGRSRLTPASREEWAEVLATADRYY